MTDRSRETQQNSRVTLRRAGLGRGLEALIPSLESVAPLATISTIPVSSIAPNPRQPRSRIDADELAVLAESIATHGVIQPIVVRPGTTPESYTLIAGERRWRASQLAGLGEIPAVVMDVSLQAQLELALVENVVRADLSAIEEAIAYRQLIDEFGLTQAEVAQRVGRSRVSVTNTLRLLLLPDRIKDALEDEEITEGHARALLGLPTAIEQLAMLDAVIRRSLSVRETESAVRNWIERQNRIDPEAEMAIRSDAYAESEQRLRRHLSTNVSIARSARGTGSIRIDFSSDEQLAELLDRIAGELLY